LKRIVQLLPRAIFACSCALLFCHLGEAQQRPNLSTIQNQIDNLQKQQQLILDKLNELEGKLSVNARGMNPTTLTTTDVRGEVFRGSEGARVAVIEYGDFECPFCAQYERETFPQILRDYVQTGKVRYMYRDLPLAMHTHAMAAARASHCAGEEGKYWEMHDALFVNHTDLAEPHLSELAGLLGLDAGKFSACLASDKFTSEIQASIAQADKLGLSATPAFVIGALDKEGNTVSIDKRIVGAVPYENFKTDLDGLLASLQPAKQP
jgi:protein-disulfide isomerase